VCIVKKSFFTEIYLPIPGSCRVKRFSQISKKRRQPLPWLRTEKVVTDGDRGDSKKPLFGNSSKKSIQPFQSSTTLPRKDNILAGILQSGEGGEG
jgi:hypothetical protein